MVFLYLLSGSFICDLSASVIHIEILNKFPYLKKAVYLMPSYNMTKVIRYTAIITHIINDKSQQYILFRLTLPAWCISHTFKFFRCPRIFFFIFFTHILYTAAILAVKFLRICVQYICIYRFFICIFCIFF